MTRNRLVQALVGVVALLVTTLAGIINAAPAAASRGDLSLHLEIQQGPRMYGRPLTMYVDAEDNSYDCLLAAIACNVPTGRIDILVNGLNDPVASSDLHYACASGGTGNCDVSRTDWMTTAAFPAGVSQIYARYVPGGENEFDAEERWWNITLAQAPTELEFTHPPTAVAGAPIELKAVVRPTTPIDLARGARLPEGFVRFIDETTTPHVDLGSGLLDANGVATFATRLRQDRANVIRAYYRGDGNYSSSEDGALIIVERGDVTMNLSQSAATTVFGQPFDLVTALHPVPPSTSTPTGDVTLSNQANDFVTTPLVNGTATTTVSNLPVGSHQIAASYNGDGIYNPARSSEISHTVNKADTTTALAPTNPNPSELGASVPLRAKVLVTAPGAGTPTGAVQFLDGIKVLGTLPVGSNGETTLSVALGGGPHNITARYLGDNQFNQSTSTPLTHAVRCDVVVTNVNGNYNVAPTGTTCITNGNVTGSVMVPTGASLSVSNSTIGGSLMATSGPRVVFVCGSTVGGASITNATGPVTVGSPVVSGCTGNTVRGGLQVQSNRGGVVVGGNRIAGWLQCSGNTPVANNGGAPNQAGGRTGECAAPTF